MATNNFFSWFSGGTKDREVQETRASWERIEREWRASPLASVDLEDLASAIVSDAMKGADRAPATPIIAALCEATGELLRAEAINEIEPIWSVIEGNLTVAVEFREMLGRRSRWATQYQQMKSIYSARLGSAYRDFVRALPEVCFREWDDDANDTFDVPLIDLIDNPAEVIEHLIQFPFADDVLSLHLFNELRKFLRPNILGASGISATATTQRGNDPDIIPPTAQRKKSPRELSDLYLAGTPFATLLELPIPFSVPEEVRFEHCHIIGGTGHGKTQLLQRMIYSDLVASQYDRRSVVVIDSQGDLIKKLSELELFSPFVGGGLGERLVLIDPSDVEHPVALNLFDAHLDRLKDYDPADRERVLNGVVELYETFFDALLGAELTQRQDVVFRYLARLMLTIPGATIHTLMEIMEDGRRFKSYMDKLEGSAKRFFETEFFSPSFSATKGQILKRLWGVLSTPAFERMFTQKENKLDLFQALNEGKIILVNTAKDLLKDEGSQLFGRFFIGMLAQAALERSTIRESERTPTFVYVDEAHEYFDDRIETILGQARKYRVSLTLSHQTLDQLSVRLRSTLLTNTSMKCVGGVSAKDARVLAEELHTTPEFIDGMRRRGPKTEFAVWVKHHTPSAIRLSVPLGFLERQHTLDDEDYEVLLERNRTRYCGTLSEVPMQPEPTTEIEPPTAPEPSAQPTRDARAKLPDPLPDTERHSAPPEPAPSADGADGEFVTRDTSSRPIRTDISPPPAVAKPVREAHGLGKGGPKHRYLQTLVKGLAESAGLKATIEATLPDGSGQVDVLIERNGVVAALEISVSTPVEHERENVRKCLRAGYPRLGVVLAKSKTTQARYAATLLEGLPDDERGRVSILTPEDIPGYIASLAPPPAPTERMVKGYKLKGTHTPSTPEEARAHREAVAKVIARSLGRRDA